MLDNTRYYDESLAKDITAKTILILDAFGKDSVETFGEWNYENVIEYQDRHIRIVYTPRTSKYKIETIKTNQYKTRIFKKVKLIAYAKTTFFQNSSKVQTLRTGDWLSYFNSLADKAHSHLHGNTPKSFQSVGGQDNNDTERAEYERLKAKFENIDK